jgi:hypothetical protein
VVLVGPAAADPPVLSAPPPTIEATGPSGAAVDLSGIATDDNGHPGVSCTPASGTVFQLGSTPVSCVLTDTTTQETATVSFTVVVVDTTPPVISGTPADITLQSGGSGAVATYSSPTGTDLVDGAVPVNCLPASGTTFPIGTTTVTCPAADSHGNSAQTSFTVTVQNTPPTIIGTPADMTVEATSSAGATVGYQSPTATDSNGTPVPVSCAPTSGATFPLGTTTVTCTATGANGNSAQSSFMIMVQDRTPPMISVPQPLTVPALGPAGAATSYTVTATDAVDGPVGVTCTPASGATFPVGTTTVSCTAADRAGNQATQPFTVSVVDTLSPVLSLPGTTAVQAGSAAGATVTFSVTAVDAVDGPVPVTCSPASGSTFPLGQTPVSCSARDAAGNATSGSFVISVTMTPPPPPAPDRTPAISIPTDITTQAQGSAGAVVVFSATAVDTVDGSIPVTCSPASGSVFVVGTTTVRCSAQDASGNSASRTFSVDVLDRTPPPAVVGLTVYAAGGRTQLRWQNPRSTDIDHIELMRTRMPDGSPLLLYKGVATSYTDTRVVDGTRYRYTVFTVDAHGNRFGVAVIAAGTLRALVRPADGARVSQPPVLVWVPAAKADYYNVQLYRDGSKVLSAWPSRSRLVLIGHWTFGGRAQTLRPGAYSWYVWPGYGRLRAKKFGTLVGSSSFVVTG